MQQVRIMPAVNGYITIYNEELPFVHTDIEGAIASLKARLEGTESALKRIEESINSAFFSGPKLRNARRCNCVDDPDESEIEIRPVLNGFIVGVGCKKVVFNDVRKMLDEIKAFFIDPDATKEKYLNKSCNSHLFPLEAQDTCVGGVDNRRSP